MARPSTKPAHDAGSDDGTAAALHSEMADPEPRQLNETILSIDVVEDAGDWSDFGDPDALQTLIVEAARAVASASGPAARLPRPPAVAGAVVALSDDQAVAALNAHYRGKAAPTNVLSFPASATAVQMGDTRQVALGDIVLAVETVAAEAADMGIAPPDHLRHLIVHGMLHLLGYDHIETAEAEEMEALETQILATIGVADPYAGTMPVDTPDG